MRRPQYFVAYATLLALLIGLSAAAPVHAHSKPDTLDLEALTDDYRITVHVGPPGRIIVIDDLEPTVAGPETGSVTLCTTDPTVVGDDEFASGTKHLAVEVHDRVSGHRVDWPDLSIRIANTLTGQQQTLPPIRMIDMDEGGGLHYGGNVYMPDGRYQLRVIANGQVADFAFVVRASQVEARPDLQTVLVMRGLAPAIYLLLGVVAIVLTLYLASGRWSPPVGERARLLFLTLVLFQGFHQVEHGIQVVQAFVLHVRGAAGLLGSVFGLEPVHFAYNTWFLAIAVAVFRTFGFTVRGTVARPLVVGMLLGLGTSVQSYHVVEHVVKVAQFLDSGLNGVPGLLGTRFNAIWLHFWLNAAAYLPFAIAAIITDLPRQAMRDLRGWTRRLSLRHHQVRERVVHD